MKLKSFEIFGISVSAKLCVFFFNFVSGGGASMCMSAAPPPHFGLELGPVCVRFPSVSRGQQLRFSVCAFCYDLKVSGLQVAV